MRMESPFLDMKSARESHSEKLLSPTETSWLYPESEMLKVSNIQKPQHNS